jgi:hypothetical protein
MLPQPERAIAASARSADAQPLTLALSRKGRGDATEEEDAARRVRDAFALSANRQPLTASKIHSFSSARIWFKYSLSSPGL